MIYWYTCFFLARNITAREQPLSHGDHRGYGAIAGSTTWKRIGWGKHFSRLGWMSKSAIKNHQFNHHKKKKNIELPQVGGMPNFGQTIWQFTQLSFGHHHPKKALRVSWKRRKRFEWIVAAVNPPNKKEVKSHWTSDRVELFIVFYLFGDYIMFILRTSLLDIEHVP